MNIYDFINFGLSLSCTVQHFFGNGLISECTRHYDFILIKIFAVAQTRIAKCQKIKKVNFIVVIIRLCGLVAFVFK